MLLWFVAKPVPVVGTAGANDVEASIGAAGNGWLAPIVPTEELGAVEVGATSSGLTPALPISTDPSGIPVREAPLGKVEDADAVIGAVPLEAGAHDATVPSDIPPPNDNPPPS
jgi:hypothetical protein